MNNNNVDSQNGLGYNKDNINDEYAAMAGIPDHTQVVDMDLQKPINDVGCKHETLIPDPRDTLGDAIYHGCANEKCPVGFYIRQDKNPN